MCFKDHLVNNFYKVINLLSNSNQENTKILNTISFILGNILKITIKVKTKK